MDDVEAVAQFPDAVLRRLLADIDFDVAESSPYPLRLGLREEQIPLRGTQIGIGEGKRSEAARGFPGRSVPERPRIGQGEQGKTVHQVAAPVVHRCEGEIDERIVRDNSDAVASDKRDDRFQECIVDLVVQRGDPCPVPR